VFRGREDGLVKVRGHRIHVDEVAAALRKHPYVTDAVVTAPADGPSRGLHAYVATAHEEFDASALRRFLAELLPPYMVPQRITLLSVLPRDRRGKLDYGALEQTRASTTALPPTPGPASTLEQRLAELFAVALGTPEPVSLDQHFFDAMGATSLTLIRIQALVHTQLGMDIPLVDFFRYPTLRALTQAIEGKAAPPREQDDDQWAKDRKDALVRQRRRSRGGSRSGYG
jgi:acyl carrier protein